MWATRQDEEGNLYREGGGGSLSPYTPIDITVSTFGDCGIGCVSYSGNNLPNDLIGPVIGSEDGAGAGAGLSIAPDNGPHYTLKDICAASAVREKGLDILSDYVGAIPVVGTIWSDVKAVKTGIELAQYAGLAYGTIKAVFSSDSTPKTAGEAALGDAITIVDKAKVIAENPESALVDGFVKDGAEAVPIAGNIVSGVALVDDIVGKDGIENYYADCLAGKN